MVFDPVRFRFSENMWLHARAWRVIVSTALLAIAVGGATDELCPKILVTFYSGSASQYTAKLAAEVAAGASDAGATVTLLRTNETSCADLEAADGIALGSPVYWAGLSSEAKRFLEDIQNVCFGWPVTQLTNKAGGAFATAGQVGMLRYIRVVWFNPVQSSHANHV